jgi:hypothetical protein
MKNLWLLFVALFFAPLYAQQLPVGASHQVNAICLYPNGWTWQCNQPDINGNVATWISSAPNVVAVSSTGVLMANTVGNATISATVGGMVSNAMQVAVVPATSTVGTTTENYAYPSQPVQANWLTAQYGLTGNNTLGYTSNTCNFYLTGTAYPAGEKIDCGLLLAPTQSTLASSWLCHATYSASGTATDKGWHALPIACTVPANTGVWAAINFSITTTAAMNSGIGFYSCGAACSPTYRYMPATYGQYTGLATTASAAQTYQASVYVTLAPVVAPPVTTLFPVIESLAPGTYTITISPTGVVTVH